jgi:hypothetical protein
LATSSSVVGKAMDKGSDVAMVMMNHIAELISKLSDDIGVMADRILTMEERIGSMADRIVRTEELMAKLTATMADKELDLSNGATSSARASEPPLLSLGADQVSRAAPPVLRISGDPDDFLLYISTNPVFPPGATVISRISTPADRTTAWQRSLQALASPEQTASMTQHDPFVLCLAVKVVADDQRVSELSNSVNVTLLS